MSPFQFNLMKSGEDYERCFNVMHELRPHLTDAYTFATRARRQAKEGYCLLAALKNGEIKGLAGYRVQENFLYGRFLYVDDLVVSADARRDGLGGELISALRDEARHQHCANFVLDTALGNAFGQRFYFRQGLLARGMHFCQPL